jgi:DNA-binding CsgD family transcriptional regulator
MAVTTDEALLGHAVDALATLVPAALVFAFTVDDLGLADRTVAVRGRPGASPQQFVELLRRLEPIDPFSPRRAQACRATIMSAVEFGGLQRFDKTLYGGHLGEHGYGAPTFVYLRKDGAITAGIGLLREAGTPPFEPRTAGLLRLLVALLERSLSTAAAGAAEAPRGSALTAREREVAGLVAGGSSNADVAHALAMSQATVKTHLTKIYSKVGVRTRTQLAVALRGADYRSPANTFG